MAETIKKTGLEPEVFRLLRCRKTRRYFRDDGWTEDATEALTFCDEMEAVRACIENGLNDVELVLRTDAGRTDIFCTPIR